MKYKSRAMNHRAGSYFLSAICLLFFVVFAVPTFAAPDVRIMQPVEGQIISSEEAVSVTFTVLDFVFVDFKNNSEPFPGNNQAGHLRFWLNPDSEFLDVEMGEKRVSDDPINLGKLSEGDYTLLLEAVRNDNTRYSPPVQSIVRFRIGETAQELGGIVGSDTSSLEAALLLLVAGVVGGIFGVGVILYLRKRRARTS